MLSSKIWKEEKSDQRVRFHYQCSPSVASAVVRSRIETKLWQQDSITAETKLIPYV